MARLLLRHHGYTVEGSSLNWTYLTEFDVEAVRGLLICDAPRLALGLVRAEQSRDDQNQRLSTLQTTRLPESLHTRAKHSETPSFIIVRCWSESCQTHRTPRTVVPVCPLGCRAAVTACVASHNATGSVERQPYRNRSPEAGLLCSSLERLALHTLRVATDCIDTLSRAPPCTDSAECSWHELL